MSSISRVLGLCLVGGFLAGLAFFGANVLADSFTDVPAANPFVDDIDWLTDYDVASGFPNGTFDPQGPVKRQQAASWLHNLSNEFELVSDLTNPPAGNVFTLAVSCPDDKRVIAGGGNTNAGVFMTDSRATDDNTWSVRWESDDGATEDPSILNVQALCVPRL